MSRVHADTVHVRVHPSRPTSIFYTAASDRDRRARSQYYATVVYWVRKAHGWIGLWGALLGLIFGLSGIWLNHRAMLKLPPMAQHRGTVQLALPSPPPASVDDMTEWLIQALDRTDRPNSVRVEPEKPVAWAKNDARLAEGASGAPSPTALMQPARWLFNFGGPSNLVQAEYWHGNQSLTVSTTSNGFLATITNLHKGVGMSTPWIMLIDTLAGSLIFLSISGVILWIQFNKRRAIGFGILVASIATTASLVGARI